MSGRQRALLVLAGTNCLWAGSYVAGKAALATWPFASVNMVRFTIAAVILLPVLWRGRHQLPKSKGDRWRLVAMCGLGFVGNKALEYLGLSLTTASDTALLIAAEALATVLLSVAFLSERIRSLEAVGLLLGGMGVYLVVEGGLKSPTFLSGSHSLGNLLVVASLILEGGFTVVGKTVVDRYPPLLITAAVVSGSLLAWWPAGFASLWARGWPALSMAGWVGIVYLGVITTALCYWAWLWGLKRVMPGAMAPLLFIQPLLGTALAVWVRGEHPSLPTLFGGLLILLGVTTVVIRREPAPQAPPATAGTA
ncbi:MAG TPA: DMT family transporter [Candidatus Dormibacteraeota bacterium]|nr:DMT family transporter [Candidatus Dormibacteraeota bacterium]